MKVCVNQSHVILFLQIVSDNNLYLLFKEIRRHKLFAPPLYIFEMTPTEFTEHYPRLVNAIPSFTFY